ncbi:MAG: HDOD domain-containing protein [Archangium sp.]
MNGEVAHLLLVDDERAVVEGLRKTLRAFRDRWEVHVAIGGRAALEALAARSFDAVVSDARMPDVDGEAVMHEASTRQPGAVRLVLSGQVDARTGHRLANLCHQFLSKPLAGPALMAAVEECRGLLVSLENRALREMVGRLQGLPVAPRVYHRISSLIDDPAANLDAVAQVLETDLALVTRVLRLVNSAIFGLTRKVGTVREAVVLLGLERVREVVLLVELLGEGGHQPFLEALRERAVARSRLARLLAHGSSVVDLAAESALLAEIGAHALALGAGDRYEPIWRIKDRQVRSEREREAFGATFAEIGAVLLGMWGLPATVANAARWCIETPQPGAALDARTITAFCIALEDECMGAREPVEVDALAAQLGLTPRLGAARELVARSLMSPSSPGAAA